MPMLLVGRATDISVPYTDSEVRSLRAVLESRSPRGGGGGGGRGGGGGVSSGGSKGSTGGSSSGSSSSGGGVRSSTPGFTAGSVSSGGALRGSSSASGVRTPYSITSGAFVGRTAGGGTRNNVYSGGGYGSGYSGTRNGRAGSTAGLGFPFIYMPLGFGALGYGYYGSQEYRRGDRPGGDETTWILQPPAGVNAEGNFFFLLGDTNSVNDVKNGLATACGSGTGNGTAPAGFLPLPTSVAQYYRASSFALGLAGYNNGQPLNSTDEAALNAPFTALPSSVNQTYFNCLNSTVGTQVPLVAGESDGALSSLSGANMLLMAPTVLVAVFLGLA